VPINSLVVTLWLRDKCHCFTGHFISVEQFNSLINVLFSKLVKDEDLLP